MFDALASDWRRQVVKPAFLNLLLGFQANCSPPPPPPEALGSSELRHMRAVNEPAVVVQGLWVTGKRAGGHLKRAALRMVAREGEGLRH